MQKWNCLSNHLLFVKEPQLERAAAVSEGTAPSPSSSAADTQFALWRFSAHAPPHRLKPPVTSAYRISYTCSGGERCGERRPWERVSLPPQSVLFPPLFSLSLSFPSLTSRYWQELKPKGMWFKGRAHEGLENLFKSTHPSTYMTKAQTH